MRISPPLQILTLCLLCAAALPSPAQPQPLFNGKDLTGWSVTDKSMADLWTVAKDVHLDPKNPKKLLSSGTPSDNGGILVNQLKDFQGPHLVTDAKFGDCVVTLEFLLPKDGNTGLFLMTRYELQLTDSSGIADDKMTEGDMGGVPFYKKPLTNASKKPGEWQTLEVHFRAPRFDASGKKTSNATITKALINDKLVQQDLEFKEPTGGSLDDKESPTAPLMLQGNEGASAFRNIRITPVK
jgi:hypothetical protein